MLRVGSLLETVTDLASAAIYRFLSTSRDDVDIEK
jgi:hypothetical protein